MSLLSNQLTLEVFQSIHNFISIVESRPILLDGPQQGQCPGLAALSQTVIGLPSNLPIEPNNSLGQAHRVDTGENDFDVLLGQLIESQDSQLTD